MPDNALSTRDMGSLLSWAGRFLPQQIPSNKIPSPGICAFCHPFCLLSFWFFIIKPKD